MDEEQVMDDQRLGDEAWRLLLALCRSGHSDLQALPAPGHVVQLTVWRTLDERREGQPAVVIRCLWGDDGPTLLDEAGYERYVDPAAGPRPGVFTHRFGVTPGWGDFIDLSLPPGVDPQPEPDGAWLVAHAFGGLHRGHALCGGLQHWVHLEGDAAVVDDTDIWFM